MIPSADVLIYLIRPNNEPIWLPVWLVKKLGVRKGQQLSDQKMQSDDVQSLLELRKRSQTERGKR